LTYPLFNGYRYTLLKINLKPLFIQVWDNMTWKKSMEIIREELETLYKTLTTAHEATLGILQETNDDMGFFMQQGEHEIAQKYMMITADLSILVGEKLPEAWKLVNHAMLTMEHITGQGENEPHTISENK